MGKVNIIAETVKFGITEGDVSIEFCIDKKIHRSYIMRLMEFLSINDETQNGQIQLPVTVTVKGNAPVVLEFINVTVSDGGLIFNHSTFNDLDVVCETHDFIWTLTGIGYPDPRPRIDWALSEVSLREYHERQRTERDPTFREFYYPGDGTYCRQWLKDGDVLRFTVDENEFHFDKEHSFSFAGRDLEQYHEKNIIAFLRGLNYIEAE